MQMRSAARSASDRRRSAQSCSHATPAPDATACISGRWATSRSRSSARRRLCFQASRGESGPSPGRTPELRRAHYSQLSLVEVVDRAVGLAFAVAESEALVEGAGGYVALAGAEVHAVGALRAGELDRGLHQRPPEPVSALLRDHVELRQVALEPFRPERESEAEHRKPVRATSPE